MKSFPASRKTARRNFFKSIGGLGALSTLLPLSATAQGAGYKGLVCVFFSGGNDSNNMLIPLGDSYSDHYLDARPLIAVNDSDVTPLTIANQNDPQVNPTGEAWGFHPLFKPAGGTGLADYFNQGDLTVVANVGNLAQPTTRAEMDGRTAILPRQLGSHRDQSLQWHSSIADRPFTTGWGGRVADVFYDGSSLQGNISLTSSRSYFLTPENKLIGPFDLSSGQALQLQMTSREETAVNALYNLDYTTETAQVPGNLFAENHRLQYNRALASSAVFADALDQFVEPAGWPTWSDDGLSEQMEIAARIIGVREALGQSRQILYCKMGGFDTHQNQNETQGPLFTEINRALTDFRQAMIALGVDDEVTTFTASDFNRTFTNNRETEDAGTDHAWGGHSIVMGGSVRGGRLHGRVPILDPEGPDFTDRAGRASWIPTTSVDEFAATLSKWFGLDPAQLASVFPNLERFSTPDLGFMA